MNSSMRSAGYLAEVAAMIRMILSTHIYLGLDTPCLGCSGAALTIFSLNPNKIPRICGFKPSNAISKRLSKVFLQTI